MIRISGLSLSVHHDQQAMMKKIAKQAADEEGRISNYWGTRVNLISVDSKTCKSFGDDGMD